MNGYQHKIAAIGKERVIGFVVLFGAPFLLVHKYRTLKDQRRIYLEETVMKKILAFLLVFVLAFSGALPVFAAEDGNIGVTYTPPTEEGVSTRSTSKPSDVWDLSEKGSYSISGTSLGQTLYTNYKFKGHSSYTVTIKNNSERDLTVEARNFWKSFSTETVSAGQTLTYTVSVTSTSTKFYLKFDGVSMSFTGSIR